MARADLMTAEALAGQAVEVLRPRMARAWSRTRLALGDHGDYAGVVGRGESSENCDPVAKN